MQSGISASADLLNAFQTLVSTPTQFGLLATITSESLEPSTVLSPIGATFEDSLPLLTPHLADKTALYIILRRSLAPDSPAPFIAITYVPDSAPVRQKMLFASTRLTLVRELGIERFQETLFVNNKAELTAEGFRKHKAHTELKAPLTEEEMVLGKVKESEAEEGRGMAVRKNHLGGNLAVELQTPAVEALKKLGSNEGGDNLVQLQIDPKTEEIELASSSTCTAATLSSLLSPTSPRFSFYKHISTEGSSSDSSPLLFIYTFPSSSNVSARKERMMYASARNAVVLLAEKEAGLTIERKMEAADVEDVTEERIEEELGIGKKVEVKKAFERPKRPGKR